uniref:AI-2E family transporter n=1 Tax=Faecalibacillus faecis TaxID=1982628 RepID=UPI003FD87B22
KRILSFITVFLLIVLFIGLICFIVGPELVHSIKMIMKQAPIAYENLIDFLKTNRNIMNGGFTSIIDSLISLDFDLSEIFNQLIKNWKPLFNSGFSILTNTVSSLSSFFIGFVFSIYLLFSKETLSRQLKTTSQALLGKDKTKKICQIIKLSSDTFTSFITGQCLEACILGSMFVISMSLLQMSYALLMGIIIAITALIPVFGAFIGCFIGIIMIGIVNPIQAVAFIILFLILQQIEGNFIYPHVVGNSVGLPSIWVFVAVIIGGNLMGILGMFLFIPLTSIIYTLFKEYIKSKDIKS